MIHRPFSKLDRYLMKKFVVTFFFMLILMVLIIVVIDIAEKIDDFIERKPGLYKIVFEYYVYFIPFVANLLIPVCVFLSVIFFTTKLTQRSETIAILSSGIPFQRLLFPYLVVAIALALFSFYLHAFVVPPATNKRMDFEYKYLKYRIAWHKRFIHKKIDQGLFLSLYSYNQFDTVGTLVSLERFEGNRLVAKLWAQRMQWLHAKQQWRLYQVRIRYYLNDSTEKMEFYPFIDTTLQVYPSDIYHRENMAESLPLHELYAYIELEKRRESDFLQELMIEKHERFAYPFAALILTFIGLSVSLRKRRGGVAVQLGIGLIICFLYIALLNLSRILFAESLGAWLAVWAPNLLFTIVAIIMVRLAPK